MTAERFWICLIGSTLFHTALFIGIAHMSPPTPVAIRAVEAFIIEPHGARPAEATRVPPYHTGTDSNRQDLETIRPQPVHKGGVVFSSLAKQIGTEVSPSGERPVSATQKPVQNAPPARTVLNSAPASPVATHSREEDREGASSPPFRQNPGIGQVMALGEVTSPRFVHRESPVYPFMARKLGKEGSVVLRIVLDAEGRLQSIETVDASGFGFTEAARAAIRKSTFAPAVRNGRAEPSQVLVPVRFVLNERQRGKQCLTGVQIVTTSDRVWMP